MNEVLLLEDDTVSREYLAGVLDGAGLSVCTCSSIAAARNAAASRRFDLLLLDVHLGDGRGPDLLRQLRADPAAASCTSPALALTAELDLRLADELHDAGFASVALKPIGAAELLSLVAGWLPRIGTPIAVWDEAQALSATGGDARIVQALRSLLRAELPGQRDRIVAALRTADVAAARAELHRLRASCGFCGAAALSATLAPLQDRLDDPLAAAQPLQRFVDAVDQLLAASPD